MGAAVPIGSRRKIRTGYMQIKVGLDSEFSNHQGWALEHRYVMEKKLGRKLERGAVIHHIDGNKENNQIENLSLFNDHSVHMASHFPDSDRKRPWEENEILLCACGCGEPCLKYRSKGRKRAFVNHHGARGAGWETRRVEWNNCKEGIVSIRKVLFGKRRKYAEATGLNMVSIRKYEEGTIAPSDEIYRVLIEAIERRLFPESEK